MSAEKAEIVEKLWNEDGKAPEFEKIFSPNTSVKIILNESEVTLGADKGWLVTVGWLLTLFLHSKELLQLGQTC